MKEYTQLLFNIAEKYHILRGKTESEAEWKTRIIYTICGLMGYVSLWDELSEEPISITHLKRRICAIENSYLELFPDVSYCFPYSKNMLQEDKDELANEIEDIFLKSGIIYHCPNRILPAKKTCAQVENIQFYRGICIDDIQSISGIGFYSVDADCSSSILITEMFDLCQKPLVEYWNEIVDHANWSYTKEFQPQTEFLKMEESFRQGYWVGKPYRNGMISLLRTGMKGSKLYYLYKYNNNTLQISPLPTWLVAGHEYRAISCACLCSAGTLPPIRYSIDGSLVHVKLNYLLPLSELYWLELYSWPETCIKFPCDFKRKCTLEIFAALKKILSAKGYLFIEE